MRWLFVSVFCSVLCVSLCLGVDQNGITNTTDSTSATIQTEPGVKTASNSSDASSTTSPASSDSNDSNATVVTTTSPVTSNVTTSLPYNESTVTKGRALNLTVPGTRNTVSGENKTKPLDDLSLDDVPMLEMHTHDTSTVPTTAQINSTTVKPMCVEKDGSKYESGEKFNRGCDESCTCSASGQLICRPRCEAPFLRKGLTRKDPLCVEVPAEDECCVLLRCTHEAETEPLEGCVHKNQTFHQGEMFNEGCTAVCSCGDGGKVNCKPRCPQVANNSSDKCVTVPDPTDPCCTVVLCDVTLGDHDVNKISGTEETMTDSQLRLKSADALNSTSAIVHFFGEPELESNLTAEISEDQVAWNKTNMEGVIVHNLKPGRTYYIRVLSGGSVSNAVMITLPTDTPMLAETTTAVVPSNSTSNVNTTSLEINSTETTGGKDSCHFKGKNFTLGQEFNDACISYCICTETGVDCSPIECPTDFGLDVLDSTCIQWETKPRDFNPVPPKCCPDNVRCIDNGSCKYMGETFANWAEIPSTLTGCEKKCYCELGNVTCQDACPPVTRTPPAGLPCPAQQAMLHHLPGDDCCLFWVCPQLQHPELKNTTKDSNSTPYLGTYNPDKHHMTDGKPNGHNILAPFGLDQHGNPTDRPLPGPVVLPYEKDTSSIPGPPYVGFDHHKPYPFKPTKDEGIHGPPPFVVKPSKEDFDKKHKYPGDVPPEGTKDKNKGGKPKNNKNGFIPTIPPELSEEDNEDYEDANEGGGHFQNVPHFHHGHPLHPGHPQVIYVNHPDGLEPHTGKPLPNEIFHPNPTDASLYHPLSSGKTKPKGNPAQTNILDLSHPGKDGPLHFYHLPHDTLKQVPHQDRRPLPAGVYDGDEEAVLHYHTQDLPDDPRIIAKEILEHLHNSQSGVFGVLNSSDGNLPFQQNAINRTDFNNPSLPPGFPGTQNHTPQMGVNVQVLEPLDEHTVRLAFSVPHVLVGLHGRVEVRYTATKHDQDPSTWELQVLAPPGDLIATPQLHFDLGNLLPDTTYSIIIKIILRDLSNTPESQVLTVRTLADSSPVTTLPPQIPIDSGLASAEVNSTYARLMWRKFTDFELQFIDGVQLRYREQDGKVFSATPLIHRLVTSYTIEDLKPNTSYEVGLFFIPFPGQTTELQSERNIHLNTALENDPYKFEINLEILTIKSTAIEITWSGVPYPEDKYVNIYRVIYQSETGKEDFNSFKVAKRDSAPKITIMDLKPTTRYRLWLEAYLTNGRTKKSNVQDFVSKPGGVATAGSTFQGKLSGTPPTMEPGDYYGPLVAVAILAALAIMAALILLLVLMRKHGQNKAAITSSRKTQSAYDNPSYKTCENDPQATTGAMNGNGVSRDRSTAEDNV